MDDLEKFEQFEEQASRLDEIELQRKIENETQILEFSELNTYGKAKFFRSKDEMSALGDKLKDVYDSPDLGMFAKVAGAKSEDDLADEQDKLLFRLKQELEKVYSSNKEYTANRDGFDKRHLERFITKDRETFTAAMTGLQAADDIFDKLMMYDLSDSKEFDSLYVAFNNVKKRYSDVSEGSLRIIQDSYDNGQKVYKINARNPVADASIDEIYESEQTRAELKALEKQKNDPDPNAQPEEIKTHSSDLKIIWKPESEPLFTHDPCPEDVMQGELGDCYFVAALQSIAAQNPDRIREMIKLRQIEEKDPNDPNKTVQSTVAVVRLYTDKNEPVDVTVPYSTCYLTGKYDGKEFTHPYFARGATWFKILEKALVASGLGSKDVHKFEYALNGGRRADYTDISGGESHRVMQTLLGPEMAEKYRGKADLDDFELFLPSEDSYKNIDQVDRQREEDDCREARNQIQHYNARLEELRTAVRNRVGMHFDCNFDIKDDVRFKAVLDEVLEDPKKADQYFKKNNRRNDNTTPLSYFTNAKKKADRYSGEIAKNQKVLDRYDRVGRNLPDKFPSVYTNVEEGIFDFINTRYLAGKPVAAGRDPGGGGNDKQYEGSAGIPYGHAYSITKCYVAPNGVKYVEVKNPHNAGTRAYKPDGTAYHDPDASKLGVSQLELRDFCRTFSDVYAGDYEPRATYKKKAEELKDIRRLYGDTLTSICNIINRSDSSKTSPEFNDLRSDAKILLSALKDDNADANSLQSSMYTFFESARIYKEARDSGRAAKTGEKENDANRYVASEAAVRLRAILEANNALPAGSRKKKADIYAVLKECMDLKQGGSAARKSSIEVLNGLEVKAKAKQQKNLDDAVKNAKKISAEAKKQLANGIKNLDEQSIVSAIATMVYLDEAKQNTENVSKSALADRFSEKRIRDGAERLKTPVVEALRVLLEEKGQTELLKGLSKEKEPVKMVKEVWEKQFKERHADALKEPAEDQVVQIKQKPKNGPVL